MGQDPREIRQGIEQTRGEMGETVEALGHKTDLTGRAKDAVNDRVQGAREKISGSTPDSGEVKEGAKRAAGIAQENPLGLAIGAAALGFVAGLLVPSTSIEDEKIGPVADDIKEKAKETGQEAMDRGKEVARQAADSAQEAGREQAEELRESSKQRADDAREQAGSSV